MIYDLYEFKNLTAKELREAYETITGLSFDDDIYDRPLTDEEIYEYLLETLKED